MYACVVPLLQDHMMSHAAETSGMMHLVSERILQEHQTAVRKIQADMEKCVQHTTPHQLACGYVFYCVACNEDLQFSVQWSL